MVASENLIYIFHQRNKWIWVETLSLQVQNRPVIQRLHHVLHPVLTEEVRSSFQLKFRPILRRRRHRSLWFRLWLLLLPAARLNLILSGCFFFPKIISWGSWDPALWAQTHGSHLSKTPAASRTSWKQSNLPAEVNPGCRLPSRSACVWWWREPRTSSHSTWKRHTKTHEDVSDQEINFIIS